MKKEYEFLAMNIVNQLFDLAEVSVTKRQEINDKAYDFVQELIESRCPVIKPADEPKETNIQVLIKWFGECIFPQHLPDVVLKFDESVLLYCIKMHYIVKSSSVKGYHPNHLQKMKNYVELSGTGWALYESIKAN
jgi:hypothetical protein